VAGNLVHRLTSLQTANPDTLYLLTSVRSERSYVDERQIHETFSAFRVIGEWFCPEPELLDFIEAIDFQTDVDVALAEARIALDRRRAEGRS
jgi:hypothetical protein